MPVRPAQRRPKVRSGPNGQASRDLGAWRATRWRWLGQLGVAGVCHGVCVGENLWDAYDKMGLDFQQHAADSAYNAHYDRPAVLAALGPVTGRRVLDAACGPGLYLRELLKQGAEVTAFDASPVMVNLARRRTADRVRIDQAALGESLPYPDGAFDLVVCALAIHYASDRAAAFAEFCRVLRPGGAAVVSTQHPLLRAPSRPRDPAIMPTESAASPAGKLPITTIT